MTGEEGTTSSRSVTTWNNCYSVGQWYRGVTFSITGDTWKIPCSVAPTTVMNTLGSLGARSGLSDILSFRLFAPVGGADWLCHSRMYICVWGGGGGADVDGGLSGMKRCLTEGHFTVNEQKEWSAQLLMFYSQRTCSFKMCGNVCLGIDGIIYSHDSTSTVTLS